MPQLSRLAFKALEVLRSYGTLTEAEVAREIKVTLDIACVTLRELELHKVVQKYQPTEPQKESAWKAVLISKSMDD